MGLSTSALSHRERGEGMEESTGKDEEVDGGEERIDLVPGLGDVLRLSRIGIAACLFSNESMVKNMVACAPPRRPRPQNPRFVYSGSFKTFLSESVGQRTHLSSPFRVRRALSSIARLFT